MPPVRLNVAFSALPSPRLIIPDACTDAVLNENALGGPMCGCPSRLKRMRSIALASVAVPTVERASAPIRCWCEGIVFRYDRGGVIFRGGSAYSSRAIRAHLRTRGIGKVIPEPDDQKAHRKRIGPSGGRPMTSGSLT